MYKCEECGNVFDEPTTYSEDRTPEGGCELGFTERIEGCPYCEGAFSKAYECEECGEYFLKEELFDSEDITEDEYQATGDFDQLCRKCIDKLVKENE